MIRSSHFFAGTPSDRVLRNTVEKCRKFGGEIVKIAAMATSEEDVARVLGLYTVSDLNPSVAEPVEATIRTAEQQSFDRLGNQLM